MPRIVIQRRAKASEMGQWPKEGEFDELRRGRLARQDIAGSETSLLLERWNQERPAIRSALHAARMLAFANNRD